MARCTACPEDRPLVPVTVSFEGRNTDHDLCGHCSARMIGQGAKVSPRRAEHSLPPGHPGDKPEHMDWSAWLAFNNVD